MKIGKYTIGIAQGWHDEQETVRAYYLYIADDPEASDDIFQFAFPSLKFYGVHVYVRPRKKEQTQ
jgi:hypothetical protein